MLQSMNWIDLVEECSPKIEEPAKHCSILYASDIEQAKTFCARFFSDSHKVKIKNEDSNFNFLRMHYRGCNYTINKDGRFEFDGNFPVLVNISSPFIFYLYADNLIKSLNEAMSYGFQKFPSIGSKLKKLELMIFLVLYGKKEV